MPETNLQRLLQNMNPELHSEEYVFCSMPFIDEITIEKALCIFREREWITVILKKKYATLFWLEYTNTFAWIELRVDSSLEAVWLTASFADALGKAGISCNVVAWYHHDHIFVQYPLAEKAIKTLKNLAQQS